MTWFAASLIFVWLATFVTGQLFLKKAMEPAAATQPVNSRRRLIWGIAAMAVSFFIKVGLFTRFDLSYLYPFEGLSVIIITLAAAVLLREALTPRLVIGSLLISAGVALVSLS